MRATIYDNEMMAFTAITFIPEMFYIVIFCYCESRNNNSAFKLEINHYAINKAGLLHILIKL